MLYAQQKQYDKAHGLEMAIRTHPSYAIAYENLMTFHAKLASQGLRQGAATRWFERQFRPQNKLAMIRDLITTWQAQRPPTWPRPALHRSEAAAPGASAGGCNPRQTAAPNATVSNNPARRRESPNNGPKPPVEKGSCRLPGGCQRTRLNLTAALKQR